MWDVSLSGQNHGVDAPGGNEVSINSHNRDLDADAPCPYVNLESNVLAAIAGHVQKNFAMPCERSLAILARPSNTCTRLDDVWLQSVKHLLICQRSRNTLNLAVAGGGQSHHIPSAKPPRSVERLTKP